MAYHVYMPDKATNPVTDLLTMEDNLNTCDISALIREPEVRSYMSYSGSFWNEYEKDTDRTTFEIFEVLSFRSCELYDNRRIFEEIHAPEVNEDNAVYNYLLAKSKKLLSLTDEEAYLVWNWNVGQSMHDGFFLFFEAQQYGFYKTPNYYDDNQVILEKMAFKSLLSKLRSHPFYVCAQ